MKKLFSLVMIFLLLASTFSTFIPQLDAHSGDMVYSSWVQIVQYPLWSEPVPPIIDGNFTPQEWKTRPTEAIIKTPTDQRNITREHKLKIYAINDRNFLYLCIIVNDVDRGEIALLFDVDHDGILTSGDYGIGWYYGPREIIYTFGEWMWRHPFRFVTLPGVEIKEVYFRDEDHRDLVFEGRFPFGSSKGGKIGLEIIFIENGIYMGGWPHEVLAVLEFHDFWYREISKEPKAWADIVLAEEVGAPILPTVKVRGRLIRAANLLSTGIPEEYYIRISEVLEDPTGKLRAGSIISTKPKSLQTNLLKLYSEVNFDDTVEVYGLLEVYGFGVIYLETYEHYIKVVEKFLREENMIFFDDFESDSLNTFPSKWKWFGVSDEQFKHQIVTDTVYHSPIASFQLWAQTSFVGTGAIAIKRFVTEADVLAFELYVMVEDYPPKGISARFGFGREEDIPFWVAGKYGMDYVLIDFASDKNIYVHGSGIRDLNLQLYTPRKWYKIKLILDKSASTFSIWIDEDPKVYNKSIKIRYGPDAFILASMWGQVRCYYDDVKVFTISKEKPKQPITLKKFSYSDGVPDDLFLLLEFLGIRDRALSGRFYVELEPIERIA
jgi:hypothetical protein